MIAQADLAEILSQTGRNLPRLKRKQKLPEEIFQKAYVHWGLHNPFSLYYPFIRFQTIPLPTCSKRTWWTTLVTLFLPTVYTFKRYFSTLECQIIGGRGWWFCKDFVNVINWEVQINGKVGKVRTTDGQLFKILRQSEIKLLSMYRFCRELSI